MDKTDINAALMAAVIDDFGNRVVPFFMNNLTFESRRYFYSN